jgi:hypothetical protein
VKTKRSKTFVPVAENGVRYGLTPEALGFVIARVAEKNGREENE